MKENQLTGRHAAPPLPPPEKKKRKKPPSEARARRRRNSVIFGFTLVLALLLIFGLSLRGAAEERRYREHLHDAASCYAAGDYEDARRVLYLLCDSVAERMRKKQVRCRTVTLWVRDTELNSATHQMKLRRPTDLSAALIEASLQLLRESWDGQRPLRSLGVQGCDLLEKEKCDQLSIFQEQKARRQAILEQTVDQVHARFGADALYRGILLKEQHHLLRVAPDSNLAATNMAALRGAKM